MEKLILASKKLQGSLILVYENGVLKSFSNEFKKPLNAVQEVEIKRVLQFNFSNVNTLDYASIGLDLVSEDSKNGKNGGQRVALFCGAYKQKYGNSYLVSRKEGALLKQFPLTNDDDFEKIVAAYFDCNDWWASPKNISGLVSRINELRQWIILSKEGATTTKWHFPNGYSKTREQECKSNEELQAYWKQLREQGYKKIRVGIVETWKKVI